MSYITKQDALRKLQKGDQIQIPSGMGGIFECEFKEWTMDTHPEAVVQIKCQGTDFNNQIRKVHPAEIQFPVIHRDIIHDVNSTAVRDADGRLCIAFKERDGFSLQARLPEPSPYRDKHALIKGMSCMVTAAHYVKESAEYIQKRKPFADSSDLMRVIDAVEQGEWVAPLAIEDAISAAGTFYDLTFWIDAEQAAPIGPSINQARQCVSDLNLALSRVMLPVMRQSEGDFDLHPIETTDGLGKALEIARAYMDQRNYGDDIEVGRSKENDTAYVLAGDLLLNVHGNILHSELLRSFSRANDLWLEEKRQHFTVEKIPLKGSHWECANQMDPLVDNPSSPKKELSQKHE